jgi:putative peptidoglycan lipid II flippase
MGENREIAKAAGTVGFFTLVSRVAGLVRDSVMGYYFGAGIAADAFFVAFRIPNLLRRFVAEGAMSTAFIPVFTEYWTTRTREEAIEAASVLATFMAILVGGLTVLGMLFSPQLTSWFAPGFVGEAGKYQLTVSLTRWCFPYIFLVSMVALCSGILNSLRHFTAPALSPVFLNIAMIASVLLLAPRMRTPVYGLAVGVLVGGCAQLGLQLSALRRLGVRLWPTWNPYHRAVQRTMRLMGPMVFGAAVYQINLLVDTILASMLPSGSVSYLWYADRVFEFPLGVFAIALGTAALPSFSAQAARGALDEMRQSLLFAMRLTNFIVMPAAVGIYLLAVPITSVLFERGAFGYPQALLTGQALAAFALGLWPVAMIRLVIPAFYALQNTRTPVLTAAAAFVANVLFSLMLMGPVFATNDSLVGGLIASLSQVLTVFDLRHAGLALSTSLAATVNLILLTCLLRGRLGGLGLRAILPSMARSGLAAAAMIAPVLYLSGRIDWSASPSLIERAAALFGAVAAGIGVYAAVQALLGSEEMGAILRQVRRRR